MTPNEITAVIASGLDRELDLPFRLQLMERVKVWRSRLVANSLQKNPAQRKFFRQAIYLKMSPVLSTPCAPEVACQIAQTTLEVPFPVRVGSQLFDYVGGPDGNSPFREVNPGTGNYVSTSQFSHLFPTYSYINRRITTPKSDQPLIRVDGIWDDPMQSLELSCSSADVPCDTWNTEYPISGDLLQLVIQMISRQDYGRLLPDEEGEHEITLSPMK